MQACVFFSFEHRGGARSLTPSRCARRYASLRPVQGRDVAHCYGAHDFEMPWGDVVVGIVLEDLGEVAKPLVEWCER